MMQCRKVYGRRDWRKRGGICKCMKSVNKSIRRCDKGRRKRWRRPITIHMMSCIYEGLNNGEVKNTLYRLARQRHRAVKDYNKSE